MIEIRKNICRGMEPSVLEGGGVKENHFESVILEGYLMFSIAIGFLSNYPYRFLKRTFTVEDLRYTTIPIPMFANDV